MDYKELKEYIYVENLEAYVPILQATEQFLTEQKLNIAPGLEEAFWNHMASLLERIDQGSMNELDTPEEHDIEALSFQLVEDLQESVFKPYGKAVITEFEVFLIALYFQQFKVKGEKK